MRVMMLPDFYELLGSGVQTSVTSHVRSLGTELLKRGHEVVICAVGYAGLPENEEENGIKIFRVEGLFQKIPLLFKDPLHKAPPPAPDRLLTYRLSRIIQKVKPDILHAHNTMIYPTLALKNTFSLPVVCTLHSYELICPNKGSLLKRSGLCREVQTLECIGCARQSYGIVKSFAKYLATRLNRDKLKAVDKFIAISSFVKETHAKYLGLNDTNIEVIHNFRDAMSTELPTGITNLPEDFILFVGRLMPDKGINILIEAYRKLSGRTNLVLIGARQYPYNYNSEDGIMVMADARQEVLLEAYRNCRFTVFPSIWQEPFGYVVLEAMMHKKAVIATRIGGLPDIVVDGETGMLVPPGDAESLSRAIKYLLENPEVAENMGHKGYERWQRYFTPEVIVPKVEQLYQSLLDRKG
jgi:glycosyltransferase involved in cell wall biosynthesis